MRISLIALTLVLTSCVNLDQFGERIEKAADAIDPARIEPRVQAELRLQKLLEEKKAFLSVSGVSGASFVLGPYSEDALILVTGENVVNSHSKDGRATLEVTSRPTLSNGRPVMFTGGITKYGAISAQGHVVFSLTAGTKIEITASGSNLYATPTSVRLKAFFVDPSDYGRVEPYPAEGSVD